ncbi:GCN5-like 1 [Penicillium taxi]|uniref:GCN5-like 1 n=1 Tax=Penicillium taxi TaxID=168475 RepID=UPI00254556B9|nr:GCN5-like 1 [Penicillium taxi]KAJ5899274.1 GCN5-like 1 [Penicillium taxi]
MAEPSSSSTTQPETGAAEEQQKKEALAAFTATLHSVGTNLEAPLRDRAATIQSNTAALKLQETSLQESSARLARQNSEWEDIAEETRQGLKEIGDVQNWAEVIERDLLALEEMMDSVEAKEREVEVELEREELERRNGDVNEDLDGDFGVDAGNSKKSSRSWFRWW